MKDLFLAGLCGIKTENLINSNHFKVVKMQEVNTEQETLEGRLKEIQELTGAPFTVLMRDEDEKVAFLEIKHLPENQWGEDGQGDITKYKNFKFPDYEHYVPILSDKLKHAKKEIRKFKFKKFFKSLIGRGGLRSYEDSQKSTTPKYFKKIKRKLLKFPIHPWSDEFYSIMADKIHELKREKRILTPEDEESIYTEMSQRGYIKDLDAIKAEFKDFTHGAAQTNFNQIMNYICGDARKKGFTEEKVGRIEYTTGEDNRNSFYHGNDGSIYEPLEFHIIFYETEKTQNLKVVTVDRNVKHQVVMPLQLFLDKSNVLKLLKPKNGEHKQLGGMGLYTTKLYSDGILWWTDPNSCTEVTRLYEEPKDKSLIKEEKLNTPKSSAGRQ